MRVMTKDMKMKIKARRKKKKLKLDNNAHSTDRYKVKVLVRFVTLAVLIYLFFDRPTLAHVSNNEYYYKVCIHLLRKSNICELFPIPGFAILQNCHIVNLAVFLL